MGHDRRGYPSDLRGEHWALVEPLLPSARLGPNGGRREKHPRRRIVVAILYVVRTGCSWRQLPRDFAPWPTVYWYFTWWHDDGTVERIHDALRGQVRAADGRNGLSAGLVDSQSVRTADTVPAAARGFDAGKKVKGRKRFIVTDTLGLLLAVHVVAANVQESAYIRTQRPVPPPLSDGPALQYDALVLNCLLDYSSAAAAEVMGQDPSKIRYLVCSAPPQPRTVARRLRPSR
ncbi:IS5 family transposase [Streptomyces mirabilis]|uniref:IS5 family transposase n=1 Tax=Streptomyces mirabilis TaxID=68239 RepID=UPI003D9F8924